MIGKTLAHYVIRAKLGQGGMGEVFVAEDTKLQRRVALKILPQEVAGDPERQSRFEREARAVAALNHPNIVTVFSVENADGIHFITMELVEGRTLAKLLPKNGFSLGELLEIAIPLADAVSSAHRTGITHRDLKPDNIIVDAEGRLRVLDFGLAKLHNPPGFGEEVTRAATSIIETEEGKILGTVAYMSPEQAEGRAVDPRSDVFSLGTILFEMSTGERPFRGDTNMSTIGSILKDDPSPVTEFNRSLPRHLGRIIRRCLAKDPERRYQTAQELRNELEQLKSEVDSGEHDAGAAPARPRRTSWIPVLAGVAVVLAVVAFIIQLWMTSETPKAEYIPHPITSTIDYERSVQWSPESESLAYSRMTSDGLDLFVQPLFGGEAVLRAGGPGDESTPRWSPDGETIAYISSDEPGSYVYLIPPYAGKPRKLIETNIPALDIETIGMAMGDRPWATDGRTLLVSRFIGKGRMAIYRVDRSTGSSEQLTFPPAGSSDLCGTYAFDGGRIVFLRRSHGRDELLTMPAAGGDPERLLSDGFSNDMPAWRTDNRHILFRSNRDSDYRNLWEIDTATGSLYQLTTGTRNLTEVSVSSDDRIAVNYEWHDTFLRLYDLATGEDRQLTSHTGDNYGARLSPDGETVAYHSNRSGDAEVWLYHLNGDSETRITSDPAWDVYPDWSPDGSRLIFVSNRDGVPKIYMVNSDGGNLHLLVDQTVGLDFQGSVNEALSVRWSPDGDRVGYIVTGDKGRSLWTVRPDGSEAREVLTGVKVFDWYLDSHRVLYTRDRGGADELVAVDLVSGREQDLWKGPHSEIDVASDGSGVTFCYGRGHLGMGLVLLGLESSDPADLPTAPNQPEYLIRAGNSWHVHHGGWSSNSKKVVYIHDRDYADIFELVAQK